jgi:multiple sugar transport system ATP-binding protein
VEGRLFRAVLDSDLSVAPGATLTLAPRRERIRWYDADRGRRLP